MSEGENEIPLIPLITQCRDCVFAEYEGETQRGCVLGRVEKFEAQGAVVTGVDDGGKRFLTISRFCNAVRKPEVLPPLPLPELVTLVRDFVRPRVAAIVYVGHDHGRHELEASLRSLGGQGVAPVKVVVLLAGSNVSPPSAINAIRSAGVPCEWEVVQIAPPDRRTLASYQGGHLNHAIDTGVGTLDARKVTYYTFGNAGYGWPPDYIGRIDAAINVEMIPLSVVLPGGEGGLDGYAVQTAFHTHPQVLGNVGVHVLEKLPLLQPEYGSGWRAMRYEELPACE